MKKIGLIGGMNWEYSQIYYQIINKKVKELLGGLHSAKCIMESLDFSEIDRLQHKNDWDGLTRHITDAAINLQNAKADVIVLCTSSMHQCSTDIIENTDIPFLHIAEATGKSINKKNINKVLLLGTKSTMTDGVYKEILQRDFNIEVITPNEEDIEIVHEIINNELSIGITTPESKETVMHITQKAIQQGIEGIVLGAINLPLLINNFDFEVPVFDSTKIHAESAVLFSLIQ
ncbi:aspartate/glutamate racemase family protein [Flammeovirga agarivorans]|uniref:Amino acid racemase n=1 Tax=Flammeovirga agarivorans TaxID=2726742 RepID=A0A7X8SJR3_9BACT|nr:amino acid racemase [Flammeovirga agarivorans]NLR91491.1 amino acid racemase [Flammeovirga agarivorans]